MPKPDPNTMRQSVIITFSDGTIGTFTGPAVVSEDKPVQISDIVFTSPQPLPDGCTWDLIEKPFLKICTFCANGEHDYCEGECGCGVCAFFEKL